MKLSTDRILTTHTGSLHRPPALEELYRKKYAGESYDEGELEEALRAGVAEVVRQQADSGLDVIDDGEYSKLNFWAYVKNRIGGIEARLLSSANSEEKFSKRQGQTVSAADDRARFPKFYADTTPPGGVSTPPSLVQMYMPIGTAFEPATTHAVVGPLLYDPREINRDINNLRTALKDVDVTEVFMPVVAPGMLCSRFANEYYKNEEDFYFATADVLNEEYKAIVNAGFLIQVDDVSLPGRYRNMASRGNETGFLDWANLAVEALNRALRGIPADRVRYHMCWASMNAPHTDDPPLTALVDHLLRINAQGYQIEAANVRHEHEYRVWEQVKVPGDKILLPGVICHATNVIEHPDYVAERILRYTNILGRERVIAATDCGFRWRIHPEVAWGKIEALVEGARRASKVLWRN